MTNKISALFDYQKFSPSEKLSKIIASTQARYGTALSDDDLLMVNAAGSFDSPTLPEDSEDERKK